MGCNPARMMRMLYALISRIEGFLSPKPGATGRSQLVGMYLEHANREAAGGLRGAANRERQNGKFSQNRRRS